MPESDLIIPGAENSTLFTLRPQDILTAIDVAGNEIQYLFPGNDLLRNVAAAIGCSESDLITIPENPLASSTAISLYAMWLRLNVVEHLRTGMDILHKMVNRVIDPKTGQIRIGRLVNLVKAFTDNSVILGEDAGEEFLAIRRKAEEFGYYGNLSEFFQHVAKRQLLKGKLAIEKARLMGQASLRAKRSSAFDGTMFDYACLSAGHPLARNFALAATHLLTNVLTSTYGEYRKTEKAVASIDKKAVNTVEGVKGFDQRLSSAKEEMISANAKAVRLKESVNKRAGQVKLYEIGDYLGNAVTAFYALRTAGMTKKEVLINGAYGDFLGPVTTGAGEIVNLGWVVDGSIGSIVVKIASLPLSAGIFSLRADTLMALAAVQARQAVISQAVLDLFNRINRQIDAVEQRLIMGNLLPGPKNTVDI